MFVYEKNDKICIDNVTNGIPKAVADIVIGFDATGEAVLEFGGMQYILVSFDTQGGSAIASQSIAVGSAATEPAQAPTRAGFTFEGWYAEAACTTAIDWDDELEVNTTIFAKWEAIS